MPFKMVPFVDDISEIAYMYSRYYEISGSKTEREMAPACRFVVQSQGKAEHFVSLPHYITSHEIYNHATELHSSCTEFIPRPRSVRDVLWRRVLCRILTNTPKAKQSNGHGVIVVFRVASGTFLLLLRQLNSWTLRRPPGPGF